MVTSLFFVNDVSAMLSIIQASVGGVEGEKSLSPCTGKTHGWTGINY